MFRMWGKLIKDNHLIKDMTVCRSDYSQSRTQMVFDCLDEICCDFDLEKPIWLDSNVKDFQLHAKPGSAGIISSNPLTLIIWKYRSLRNKRRTKNSCLRQHFLGTHAKEASPSGLVFHLFYPSYLS